MLNRGTSSLFTRILIAGLLSMSMFVTPGFSQRAEDISDSDVTSAIDTELYNDSAVSANEIDVFTEEGIVTLKGSVNSLLAKERPEAIAGATVGVRSIINQIEVIPKPSRTDNEILEALQSAWVADSVTESYELSATVTDGIVTLRGAVDSYAERQLAEDVTKSIRGVKGIHNEVEVEYDVTRTDAEIQNEISGRLENDVRVDDYMLEVHVEGGDVRLSGKVGSLQEKKRAGLDAWVAGVRAVDTDDIEIVWWARDEMRRKKTHISRTDEQIKQAVEDTFVYDPRVYFFNPSVEVNEGTVTLTGTVENLAAKRAAEENARNTLGVWRVKNHLKIRTNVPEDDVLRRRVSTKLLNDPYIEHFDVLMDINTGWVALSGEVNTLFEKNRAERIVEEVKGVLGVRNNIQTRYSWAWKPDWEMLADVRDQLEWSVFVDQSDISVSVDDGIVTLTGMVDSWSEYDEAEKNAFQGGAKDVINHLDVNYGYYGPYGPDYYYYGYNDASVQPTP